MCSSARDMERSAKADDFSAEALSPSLEGSLRRNIPLIEAFPEDIALAAAGVHQTGLLCGRRRSWVGICGVSGLRRRWCEDDLQLWCNGYCFRRNASAEEAAKGVAGLLDVPD